MYTKTFLIMKQHIIFTLSLVLIFASACKKDNQARSTGAISNTSLAGHWKLTEGSLTQVAKDKTSTTQSMEVPIKEWEFTAQGGLYLKNGAAIQTVSYQVVGGNQISVQYGKNTQDLITVQIEGNKMTLSESRNYPDGRVTTHSYVLLKQ